MKNQFAVYFQDSRKYGSYDPYIRQDRSKYGSYDPYTAQHRSKYGSYDPYIYIYIYIHYIYIYINIGENMDRTIQIWLNIGMFCRKFENPKCCRKNQIFKMTQKSFSAYPKIPKSIFSIFIDFLCKIPHFYPLWGGYW